MKANYRILLIEDNSEDAELIKIELEKSDLNLQVDHISDINSFEPYFEDQLPDLVISDYNLPNSSGIENIQRVKKHHPDLPFILVSGYLNEEDAIESMVAGASDYVMKDNLKRLNPAVQREIKTFEELRQNKRLLEEAYQMAGIGHWEFNLLNNSIFWSKEIKRLHEVPDDFVPDLETAFNFYKPGVHREKLEQCVSDAIEHGTSFKEEFKIQTAKGKELWVRVAAETFVENGRTVMLYGSTQDITQQKNAALQLEETESHLRNIVEQSTNMFYRHDVDHKLNYVSPQCEYFLGCSAEEAKVSWKQFVSDHEINAIGEKSTQKALDTGEQQPPFELQLKRKDGKVLWVVVNETPIIEEGKVVGISGSLSDFTQLKEAQERTQMLSMVASETHNLVIITDADQKIEWVNQAFIDTTGYTLEEVIGTHPGKLLQGPDTNPNTTRRIKEKMSRDQSFSETILNYTKSGNPYWVKLNVTPILDQDGNAIKYFSIQEDITEQKEYQQRITLQKEQLEESQRVGKMGHWTYYQQAKKMTWSDNMYRIYGLDPAGGPPDYEKMISMYADEEDLYREKMAEVVNDGDPFSFDIKLTTCKGIIKYLHIEGIIDKDSSSNLVTRIHGVSMDITERKLAELELKARDKELQRITNNIDGLFLKYVLKPNSTDAITFISDGVRKIHELEPHKVLENPKLVWDLTLEEDLDELQKSIQVSAEALSHWDHKWRIKTPGGKVKWLHGRGLPHRDENDNISWDTFIVDVTQPELAKIEREELYNILKNNTSEIYIMDSDSMNILYVNEFAIQQLGYSEKELLGKSPGQLDLCVYENPEAVNQSISQLKKGTKNTISFEAQHIRKDGTTYYTQVQMARSTYKGQDVIIKFGLDITNQKQVNARLRSLLDMAPIAIYMQNKEGRIVDLWNKSSEKILGFSSNEIMGQFLAYKNDPELNEYESAIELVKQGKTLRRKEVIKRRKDGSYFPARINAVSLEDEGDLNDTILITLEDISEEKELEINLKDQLSFNNTTLDSLPGLFYMVDKDLKLQRVNKNFKDFFNLNGEALSTLNPLNFFHSEDLNLIFQKIKELKDTGSAEAQVRVMSGGKSYYFYINGKKITLGDETFIIGNGINIDSRIRAEQHNEVLLQEVHHRVKNNLAIISGLLWLEMTDMEENPAKLPLQRSITRIHSMAKVHELLYDTSNLSTISIDKYLNELSDIIKNTFSVSNEVKIHTEVDELEMSVNEAVPLGMLFNELMSNSIKYAFTNGKGDIFINISRINNTYQVRYSDNGPGFKEGFDLNNSDTLGMNIIKTLLEQLRAKYTLDTHQKFQLEFSFKQKVKGSHSNI